MATNTKNFNFKKPDESDFYSIQDQNGNWDLADEELQKLNEPAFEDYTTGTSVPPAATALEALKSKIKLPVWMSNVVAFCKGCCTLAMIVNNCVSSDADKPLAAAQGKALQDQLTKLYSDLFSNVALVTDVHNIGKGCLFRAEYGAANTPTSDLGYIGISVYISSSWQFVICSPYAGGKLFFDSVNANGSWIGWKEITFK